MKILSGRRYNNLISTLNRLQDETLKLSFEVTAEAVKNYILRLELEEVEERTRQEMIKNFEEQQ